MKILFVHTFYAERGGEDTVFQNEKELLSEIAEVRELCFSNAGRPLSVAKKFLLAPWNFLALKKFKKAVKDFKPNIIHIHNWYFAASPLIIRAAKAMKIPVVVTLHNYRLLCPSATLFNKGVIFRKSLTQDFPWSAVKEKAYRNSYLQTFWLAFTTYLHRRLKTWQMVDKYIALTDFAKDLHVSSSLNLNANQIDVKGNFVQDKGCNTSTREDFFLFVGRLTQDKGITLLLKAFENTQIKLVIIGDGPLKRQVQEAVKNNFNISYLGTQSNAEIIKMMKKSSALLFPSVWYEGMPMTILEAFSCGTPVIASKLGAMENLVIPGYNGMFFKAGDVEDLASVVISWTKYAPSFRETISRNARKSFEDNFTRHQNLNELLKIYRSAMMEPFEVSLEKSSAEAFLESKPI